MKVLRYTPHADDFMLCCSPAAYELMKDPQAKVVGTPQRAALLAEHLRFLAEIEQNLAREELAEHLEHLKTKNGLNLSPAVNLEHLDSADIAPLGVELIVHDYISWEVAALWNFLEYYAEWEIERVAYSDKIWSDYVGD